MFSTLAEKLQINPHELHDSSDSIRASPVFAMESFQRSLLTPSGNQFIMITVHLRTNQPGQPLWTYVRIDFSDQPFPHGRQLAELSDDHEALREDSRGLGRLEGSDQPVENGPSLDDIASLLEVVHRRTLGGYNTFGRNSLWLAENILLPTARKYPQHWVAGRSWPEALKRYAQYNSDAAGCIAAMLYPEPVSQTLMGAGIWALRSAAVFFTQSNRNRIISHDEDVQIILLQWNPCVKAGFI
ncbi:uncharacterized protein B0H18DRAFT_976214 [Fomitopsis serialis]|uniref:uncharacterized protein n=1 Tax=Fomitopsis serialis TaxID=139415 RepID=UPI00200805B3|nr:uncharacterized protein B0H18DRAFT_976214 [Neoantrodia serialis]KAH9935548.1 hypothetical protein B0H18DRAFT_976214 [Neoantrodia serialis]